MQQIGVIGYGLDCLVVQITQRLKIRDVLQFPTLKSQK